MRFNQTVYAEFYHKQMVEAGYPGKLLPFILGEIKDSSTVLDIGSGTGFFSIPLAQSGHRITAVEPSTEMINIMKKNINPEILSRISIYPTVWEEWRGDYHDAAIAIHSLYPMTDIKKAVALINKSAEKKIIIVRDASGMKTLSGIVREKLGIVSNRDLNVEVADILNNSGIKWKVEKINEHRKQLISDAWHEADSILYQLKVDESCRSEIYKIVNSEITHIDGSGFFEAIYSDNAYIFI